MKVISFSLWGDDPKYTIGAIKNAELAKKIYPGWVCKYYVGDSVPADCIQQLSFFDNCEIVKMNVPGNWEGMFWRFLPASDKNVDAMISRDTDSRLNMKEKAAVDDWLNSDFTFHIMRDHPWHTTAILGGMWGAKKDCIESMGELIKIYPVGNYWQTDQHFLKDIIYPMVKDKAMIHDPFFDNKPFPVEDNSYFVGQPFNSDESTEAHFMDIRNGHRR